jgi:hypothetical protein
VVRWLFAMAALDESFEMVTEPPVPAAP